MWLLFFIALITGCVVGMLPGVGLLFTMVVFFPFLKGLPPEQLIMFYLVVGGTSQFTGSVIASIFGIPGENSSIPASIEGPKLCNTGRLPETLSACAIGSMVGTFAISIFIILILNHLAEPVTTFFNNTMQLLLFVLSSIVLILSSKKKYMGILLFLFGCLLSMIGFDQINNTTRLTFDLAFLQTGIPFASLISALFTMPYLYRYIEKKSEIEKRSRRDVKIAGWSKSWRTWWEHRWSSARGIVIGSICGLVPGLTTILSSNLSYHVEKTLRIKKNIYKKNGDLNSLISAETANNAGQLTSVVPLFLFGLPILASEAVLINLIEKSGFKVAGTALLQADILVTVCFFFMLAAILAMLVSWHGVKYLMLIHYLPKKIHVWVMVFINIFVLLMSGIINYNLYSTILCFILLLPLGYILRKNDLQILIFAAVIYPILELIIFRFYQLNFQ